jgi:CheY-like chemotaxis protein
MIEPICIVMADDDEDDCLNMRDAFARNRVAVDLRVVKDGAELLDYLHQRGEHLEAPRPRLILLDLNMPRKNGRETLAEIKADPALRTIPVVVLTTSKSEEDVLRSYDLGANSYVSKPVTFDSLVRMIGELGNYWFHLVELPPPDGAA